MKPRLDLSYVNVMANARARCEGTRNGAPNRRPTWPATKAALLVVSKDTDLCEKLRQVAVDGGRLLVVAAASTEALAVVRSARTGAVLLDLDMPAQEAWQVADGLLQEADCPPMILLTARREQFDMGSAIRAGTLIDKDAECGSLAQAIEEAVALPEGNRAARNEIQRVAIRWLRPCAWSVPITPSHRFWGLNE